MDESKIYLCRCENVTLADLHKILDAGVTSMEEVKRYTRCTKGPCQGRTCKELIAKEMARYLHVPIESIDIPKDRAPIKPIPMGEIVKGDQ